ncbi:MAG: hypothetical protein ACPHO4_07390 [Longimicrobiales bacterium]
MHVVVGIDRGDLEQHISRPRASSTGGRVELEKLMRLIVESHPAEVPENVLTFGQLDVRKGPGRLPGQRPREQERDHPVRIDPPKVPGIEEDALTLTANDLVEKLVDRRVIE